MSDEQNTVNESDSPKPDKAKTTVTQETPSDPVAATAAKPAPAAKAAKAPAPPDPRVVAAKEIAEQIKSAVVSTLGESAVEEVGNAHFKPMVRFCKEDWARAVELLRTHPDWKLNYTECMAGTDYPDYIELSLFVQSTELGHFVCLKTRTDRDTSQVPTLVASHPGVNWEEREIYDLLGVNFVGHPDLRRIMMWDEFTGHPLRKDYSAWD